MYKYTYIYINTHIQKQIPGEPQNEFKCESASNLELKPKSHNFTYIYIYTHICIYKKIYTYTYINTHTQKQIPGEPQNKFKFESASNLELKPKSHNFRSKHFPCSLSKFKRIFSGFKSRDKEKLINFFCKAYRYIEYLSLYIYIHIYIFIYI
jgi:hypothetical protein